MEKIIHTSKEATDKLMLEVLHDHIVEVSCPLRNDSCRPSCPCYGEGDLIPHHHDGLRHVKTWCSHFDEDLVSVWERE